MSVIMIGRNVKTLKETSFGTERIEWNEQNYYSMNHGLAQSLSISAGFGNCM